MLTRGFCAYYTRVVRVLASVDNTTPRSSPAAHTFDVAASEAGEEDIVEDSVDKDLHGKQISVLAFHPQKYERRTNRLTISHGDELTNPLRVVSKKHEDELM